MNAHCPCGRDIRLYLYKGSCATVGLVAMDALGWASIVHSQLGNRDE